MDRVHRLESKEGEFREWYKFLDYLSLELWTVYADINRTLKTFIVWCVCVCVFEDWIII